MGRRYKKPIPPSSQDARAQLRPDQRVIWSKGQHVPGFYTLIDTTIAFGWPATIAELRDQLEPLPLRDTLGLLGALGAILHNNRNTMKREVQLGFLNEFSSYLPYNRRIKQELQRFPDSVLQFEEQFVMLHKFAALYCKGAALPRNFQTNFVRAMLAFNYLLGHENLPSEIVGLDDFVKLEMRSAFTQSEQLLSIIHRYCEFIDWTRSDEAKALEDIYLPVHDDLKRLIGMSYDEYLACGFAIIVHYLSIKGAADASNSFLFPDSAISGLRLRDATTLRRWIDDHSQSLSDFQAANSGEEEEQYSGVSMTSLLKKPLLRLDDATVCCPYLGYLENRMGAGLYFRIYHAYEAEGKQQRFSDFFSRFFERHIVQIVDRASTKSGLIYRAERKYRRPGSSRSNKSTDVVIFEKPNTVWLEVVASRVNYVRTLKAFEDESVNRDFKNIILDKAKQLHDNIRAFREGRLRFDGIEANDFDAIFPVVVVVAPFPQFMGITSRIQEALKDKNHLQDTMPLQIIEAESLEMMEVALSQGLKLSSVLEKKVGNPQTAAMNLRNYKAYVNPGIYKSEFSTTALDTWAECWTRMATVWREWGMTISTTPPSGLART